MTMINDDQPLMTPEEKKRQLLELWEIANKGICELVSQPEPVAYHLDIALRWLRQNNVKKDVHSISQVREALADMQGLGDELQ